MDSVLLPQTWYCRWHLIYDNKRASSSNQALAFTSVMSSECRCLTSESLRFWIKWCALSGAYTENVYLPICVVSVVIILEWSRLQNSACLAGSYQRLSADLFIRLCSFPKDLMVFVLVINIGANPGPWLRGCKRHKTALQQADEPSKTEAKPIFRLVFPHQIHMLSIGVCLEAMRRSFSSTTFLVAWDLVVGDGQL